MMLINGAALVLNIAVLTNLAINRRALPPYMWLVINLATADLLFAFLGPCSRYMWLCVVRGFSRFPGYCSHYAMT